MTTRRLFALALIAPALLAATSEAGPFARILATPHDAVTTPGVAVAVEAKFERKGFLFFNPDMRGEPVAFDVGGPAPFTATTDRDGLASVGLVAAGAGVYSFQARLLAHSGAPSADGRLFVLDRAQPVVVVDIDQTLSDLPSWQVPLWGATAPTYPGAVSLMTELARTHTILYLTARDDSFDAQTRVFLARQGFPDGPILYNDLGLTTRGEIAQLSSSHHGEFKVGVIRALQQRGVNVAFGIGNAETDAFAYENAGIPSFIRTTQVGAGPSFRFLDYAVLRLELVGRGILP